LVAYLSPADNTSGSLPSRLRGGNQPVIRSRNPFSRPHPVWLPCVWVHLSRSTPRSAT